MAVLAGENLTAIVGIKKEFFVAMPVLHEEVSRHADTGDWKVQPSRHFDVYRRQGDRYPDASIEHVIEKTVARVVIVIGVAPKCVSLEKHTVDLLNHFERLLRAAPFLLDRVRDFVEQLEIGIQFQLRIFLA